MTESSSSSSTDSNQHDQTKISAGMKNNKKNNTT